MIRFEKLDHPSHFCWATDDRYHCHYVFASLVRSIAYIDAMQPSVIPSFRSQSVWLEGCGYWVYWPENKDWTGYVGAKKGGLVRIHQKGDLSPILDYGWRVEKAGTIWSNNWWSQDWQIQQEGNDIRIRGNCQKTQFHVPGPPKHFVLRVLSFLLREKVIPLLKRVMIFRPGVTDGPQFERLISIDQTGIQIEDRFSSFSNATAIPSPRQNLRHVASADSFSREEWLTSLIGNQSYSLEKATVIHSQWSANKL